MASEKSQQKPPIGDLQIWKKNTYISTHTHTPILKNIAIWKKIYEMCINNRFIYFIYILKFQCFLKTDVYIQYIFFKYHVGITCSSRCKPRNFHLNKLVIDYNQYLSTYLKQGKSAISWSSNSYKNIRNSINININTHSKEEHVDQYSVELNSSFLTLAVSM